MHVQMENYAGQATIWVGDSGLRVRHTDNAYGIVKIEKGIGQVVLTREEARALAAALLQPVAIQ